jgi:hypothetical protein
MQIIRYLSFVLLALVTASAQARFLSVDPVGFKEGNPASFNRYAYANNNPYKYIDPDGREAVGAISFSYGLLPHSGMAPQSTVDTMTTGLVVTTGLLSVPVGFGIVFPAAIEAGAVSTELAVTAHGATRIAGQGATRGGTLTAEEIAVVRAEGKLMTAENGASVRIMQNEAGRSSVVVEGERGVITTLKDISQKAVDRLSKNYGWKDAN